MISEWIDRVGEDEQILHMGDVFMGRGGNARRWASIVSRLPGQKYLLMGNHDKEKQFIYENAGFTVIPEFVYNRMAFTHAPITERHYPNIDMYDQNGDDWEVNIHGHVHNNPWNAMFDGHKVEDRTYINVSVEVMDFKPVRLGNICPVLKTREKGE